MWRTGRICTRFATRSVAVACAVALAMLGLSSNALAVTTLVVNTAPTLPALTGVTLNGQTQTTTTAWTMANNIKITSSGTNSGWNVTVGANTTGGTHSAVFKQYCPNATCGADAGPGYVAGGFTLPANSLTWNTTGSSWTSAAPRPAYQCSVSPFCFIDHATATKVV